MTAVATTNDPAVRAEEYELRIADIDPDPAQPRLEVDDELTDSIDKHGVLKAIEVRPHPEDPDRYMIVDGERRWRGAKKAGLTFIPSKLTLEVDGVNIADRMVRQIVHNTGKPLTPVEEAIAFKKIIDARRLGTPEQITVADALKRKLITKDEAGSANPDDLVMVPSNSADPKYGPVALARELGLPKSTVTDRLATMEIPSFWLPFIVKGPLQSSHVPSLHKWRKLPEKFQLRGLEKMKNDFDWPGAQGGRGHATRSDRLYVGTFEKLLDVNMRSYVKPVSEVPGYKGPTEKLLDTSNWPRKVKVFAMDPAIWQPIARKKSAERAKKRNNGKAPAKDSWREKYQKQQDEQTRRYEAERRRQAQYTKAAPALARAFAEQIAAAPVRDLQTFVLQNLNEGRRSKKVGALVAVGTTPEQFVRHLAMLEIAQQLSESWGVERKVPALGKRFKVDVAAIVKPDADEKEEKRPDPATTDPGAQGDGLLAVVAADEDEDDG